MYAVIDLGSNSFHLLIADCDGSHFSIVDRCSKKIQLADGLVTADRLSSAAMERGMNCLREFKDLLDQYPIEKRCVVATQAIRQAKNSKRFVKQVKTLGLEVDIISGAREAELIFHGICNALPVIQDNRLIIDIGGASTEIAVGNHQSIALAESIPMGCVAWRDRFFSSGIPFADCIEEAKAAAQIELEPLRGKFIGLNWAEVYASSGSAKMLYTIAKANGWSDDAISSETLLKIKSAIAHLDHHSNIQLAGLKKDRQDLLAPGLSIMMALMETLNFDVMNYSKTALREGVLGEMMEQDDPPSSGTKDSIA